MRRLRRGLGGGACAAALLVGTLLVAASSPAGAAECWRQFPGQATTVEFGPDGSMWATDRNHVAGGYGVMRWTGSGWVHVDGGVRAFLGLAVGPDGEPWIVDGQARIFRLVGGVWQQMPGAAYGISGGDGSIWVLGTNAVPGGYGIYKWNGSGWSAVDGGASIIDVDAAGRAWIWSYAPGAGGTWNGTISVRLDGAWQPWVTDSARLQDIAGGGAIPVLAWRAVYRPEWGANQIQGWSFGRWRDAASGIDVSTDMSGRAWYTTTAGDIYQMITFCGS